MNRFFIGVFALGVISTHASLKDVGVIGPKGEVLLYSSEGRFITVKSCSPNTILGTTPTEANINCPGNSIKIPINDFKQSILNLVSGQRLYTLKPVTPSEILDFRREGPTLEHIRIWEIELEKINTFIATYGPANANLVRKEELMKALQSQETRVEAIKKINSEVEKTINLIVDQTKLTLTKFNSDNDQFLYTVLKQFNSKEIFPCGLKGSVSERIQDCSYQINSVSEGFVLVTRTKDFKTVYKEISTGLLWSHTLSRYMQHFSAKEACYSGLSEVGGISHLTWRLPSKEDYEEAEKSKIRVALPDMNDEFWTSTIVPILIGRAWQFDNYENFDPDRRFRRVDRYRLGRVRCVADDR